MAEHEAEPWLRGTHTDMDPVRRAVLHALELAEEDVLRWTRGMDLEAIESEPMDLPSVGFQMRHIARSLDRLLTYAAGEGLSHGQLRALQEESLPGDSREALLQEFLAAVAKVEPFMLAQRPEDLPAKRSVGRSGLPTTLVGLLIHMAEHTQRHVGQLVTTAKVVLALREAEGS